MPRFIIERWVSLRETIYQWRAYRYDRRRHIDHKATMKYYRDKNRCK